MLGSNSSPAAVVIFAGQVSELELSDTKIDALSGTEFDKLCEKLFEAKISRVKKLQLDLIAITDETKTMMRRNNADFRSWFEEEIVMRFAPELLR